LGERRLLNDLGSTGAGSPWKLGPPFLAACFVVYVAAAVAGVAGATTAPGSYVVVHGVLTNSQLVLKHSTRGGGAYVTSDGNGATFVRGTSVIFRFRNTGSRPYLPAVKVIPGPYMPPITNPADKGKLYTLAAQRVAPPGGRVDFVVTFLYRGQYRLLELLHKHPQGRAVQITIT
jgi:hypothetical protein